MVDVEITFLAGEAANLEHVARHDPSKEVIEIVSFGLVQKLVAAHAEAKQGFSEPAALSHAL